MTLNLSSAEMDCIDDIVEDIYDLSPESVYGAWDEAWKRVRKDCASSAKIINKSDVIVFGSKDLIRLQLMEGGKRQYIELTNVVDGVETSTIQFDDWLDFVDHLSNLEF